MKCVLCIKESYSKEKKVKIFTFGYGQAGSGDPTLPYGQPDRKIPRFFMPSLAVWKYVVIKIKCTSKILIERNQRIRRMPSSK